MELSNSFFEQLFLPLSKKEIILIDFDNKHGVDMYNLLTNKLYNELNRLQINWIKINSYEDLFNTFSTLKDEKNKVICIPLAWQDDKLNNLIVNMSKNNIIISPLDKDYIYPWSLDGIYCADKEIEWYYSDDNFQKVCVNGYSVYCILLSIIAVKGRKFLENFIRGNNNE